jgi:hypothetical protein
MKAAGKVCEVVKPVPLLFMIETPRGDPASFADAMSSLPSWLKSARQPRWRRREVHPTLEHLRVVRIHAVVEDRDGVTREVLTGAGILHGDVRASVSVEVADPSAFGEPSR